MSMGGKEQWGIRETCFGINVPLLLAGHFLVVVVTEGDQKWKAKLAENSSRNNLSLTEPKSFVFI